MLENKLLDDLERQYQLAKELSDRKLYTEAESVHRQTWQARQRVLGHEHPNTLRSQNQLAWTLGELMRYEEAEILNRQTWQTRLRVLRQEDPDTLHSQHYLAWTLYQLKRYEESETIDRLSAGNKSSSLPGLRDISSQETSSFVTCQESKTFLEDLVSQAEPSVASVETTISIIQNVSTSLIVFTRFSIKMTTPV